MDVNTLFCFTILNSVDAGGSWQTNVRPLHRDGKYGVCPSPFLRPTRILRIYPSSSTDVCSLWFIIHWIRYRRSANAWKRCILERNSLDVCTEIAPAYEASGPGIIRSADQYGVTSRIIDLLTMDVTQHPWRTGGLFDAIVTDPPCTS